MNAEHTARRRHKKMHQRTMMRVLVEAFGREQPVAGCEVGVYKGQLSAVLLNTLPLLKLTMVDPWRTGVVPVRTSKGDEWSSFDQNSWDALYHEALEAVGPANPRCRVMRMTSEQAALQTPDKSFDFVFIDADHTYEAVRRDIQLWLPKTKRILCGHDYGGKNDRVGVWGVRRAVDEAFGSRVRVRGGLVWVVDLQA